RFQADADLHQMIVTALVRREPGVDFQTATAAGLGGLLDPQVLERAATEGRVLVSHDQSTMPQHFAAFIQNQPSAGLLIVPQHLGFGEPGCCMCSDPRARHYLVKTNWSCGSAEKSAASASPACRTMKR